LFNGNNIYNEDNFEDNEDNMNGPMSGYERTLLNKSMPSSIPRIYDMNGPSVVMGLNNNYPNEVKTSADREHKSARDYSAANKFSQVGSIAPSVSIANSIDAEHRREQGGAIGVDGDYGGPESFEDDIKNQLSIPMEKGGSNFFTDEDGNAKYFDSMMKYVGKQRVTKNFNRKQGKWDPGDQDRKNRMMFGGPSVSELRKNTIDFKPASRSHKTNYINLVRLSNQTAGKMQSQYVP
jgi:hypothetical protein